MKKIAVLIVGASIALASCGGNAGMDQAAMQHKIDSTANELAKSDIERLQKSCDDAVMQAAQDSAKAIMAAEKHATKKATTKHSTTTKHDEPTKDIKTKVDPKKDKMSGNHNTNVEDKKSKMSGEETKSNVEVKKSKMNKMKATENK